MGRYNSFAINIQCPFCSHKEILAFEASIGVLVWDYYEVSDEIRWELPALRPIPIGPNGERPDGSYWATGIAHCRHCREDVLGRVFIRNNRFVRVEFPDVPDGLYDWGTLPE